MTTTRDIALQHVHVYLDELAHELREDARWSARIAAAQATEDLVDLLERQEVRLSSMDRMHRRVEQIENALRDVGPIPAADTMSQGCLLAVRTLVAEVVRLRQQGAT